MSDFCALTGYCSELLEDFDDDQVLLCASTNKISQALANGKYSYMVISDGTECEHVKVTIESSMGLNKIIAIERGVGWTEPVNWPKGTKIYFDWTNEAWMDAYECFTEDEDNNTDLPKIEGYNQTTDENGRVCYELDEDSTLEVKIGKYRYTIRGLDYDKEACDPSELPQDGVYQNATVTVQNCEITKVVEGCKVTIGGCSPGCKCDDCTDTTAEPV